MMNFAVIVFPGSNCDHDAYHVLNSVLDISVDFVCEDRHKLSTETRKNIEDNSSQSWSELLQMFIESYL